MVRRLLCVLLLAGVSACGGTTTKSNGVDAKSPDAILAASKHAADNATSVHVAGSVAASGAPTTFDLRLVKGQGGTGSLSVNGLSFDLIRVGSSIYVKGSPAFYRKYGGAAAQLLQGKWLKSSATTGSFATVGQFTELPGFLDQLLTPTSGRMLTKGRTTTVAGKSVVELKDGTGATLTIATTDQPYPVQISKSGTGGGSVTFDQWNASVPLTAPPGAVDVNTLAGR